MNNKALTMSLIMAVFAVFMVQSYVSSIEESTKKQYGTQVLVVTAKRDIKEMETINETMIETALKPKNFLEPSALSFPAETTRDEQTKSIRSLVGTIAVVPIKKGEQVTFNKINEPGIRTGLAPQVTPGKRAISIPVNDFSGVSKLIKPGDRVDIIAIVDPGGGKERKTARTVLQDTPVLAVGRSVTNNAARVYEADTLSNKERVRSLAEDYSFNAVTIEVEPAAAQALALLISNGESSLSVSLRNSDDSDRFNLGPVTYGELVGSGDLTRGLASQRR